MTVSAEVMTRTAAGGRWVALLRGINVGGNNRLAMADLRVTAESLGWSGAATYIQSGNLAFTAAAGSSEAALAASLRRALAERNGLDVAVVVRSAADLERIAGSHPGAGGPTEPNLLHVMVLDVVPPSGEIDRVAIDGFAPDVWVLDGREIYLSYPNGSGRTKLTIDVFERAWHVTATARNLNTMTKIAKLANS